MKILHSVVNDAVLIKVNNVINCGFPGVYLNNGDLNISEVGNFAIVKAATVLIASHKNQILFCGKFSNFHSSRNFSIKNIHKNLIGI